VNTIMSFNIVTAQTFVVRHIIVQEFQFQFRIFCRFMLPENSNSHVVSPLLMVPVTIALLVHQIEL